jgi:hypothetical protein
LKSSSSISRRQIGVDLSTRFRSALMSNIALKNTYDANLALRDCVNNSTGCLTPTAFELRSGANEVLLPASTGALAISNDGTSGCGTSCTWNVTANVQRVGASDVFRFRVRLSAILKAGERPMTPVEITQDVPKNVLQSGFARCAQPTFLVGYDTAGNMICESVPISAVVGGLSCPTGQAIGGFRADGTLNCVGVASGTGGTGPSPPSTPPVVSACGNASNDYVLNGIQAAGGRSAQQNWDYLCTNHCAGKGCSTVLSKSCSSGSCSGTCKCR